MQQRVPQGPGPRPRRRVRLTRAGLLTIAFVLAVLTFVALVSHDTLTRIATSARQSREVLIPDILARQRSAMNIERLGRFGEIIFQAKDPAVRRSNRLTARILMQDLAFEPESATHAEAQKVFKGISTIARLRDRQDALRAEAAGLERGLGELVAAVDMLRLERPGAGDRAAMGGVLQALNAAWRELDVLLRAPAEDFAARRGALDGLFDAAAAHLADLGGAGARDLGARLAEARTGAARAVAMQAEVLDVDAEAAALWAEISAKLDRLADSIATDAGLRAVTMAEDIKVQADRVGTVSYAMTGTLCALLVLLVWVFRRHVMGPILAVTRALEAVHAGNRDVDGGPRALFVELDAIGRAVERYAGVLRELRESNEKLHGLSMRDGLTDLANRRHFDRELEREASRARRNGRPLSLLMLDVDHFKVFNDSHGHMAGDACLAMVAGVLREAARRPGDLAARYGGEEFALLLPEVDPAEARAVAERVRTAIEALRVPCMGGEKARVTISVGVATLDAGWAEPERELLRAADDALYKAKSEGRNRVCTDCN